MTIREYLSSNDLITDGAMGTYYEEKYGHENEMAEYANDSAPEKIKEIHLEYLRSGARLLRTNTFASNSLFFDTMDAVEKNIRAACRAAEDAVKQYRAESGAAEPVFLAADIGPIYDAEHMEYEDVLAEYQAICDVFLDCGMKCFVFETQADFTYLEPLSRYLKEKNKDLFLLAQFSFDKSGYTRAGMSVDKLVRSMGNIETIDAYGMNCGVEATHMYRLLKDIAFPAGKWVTALPNAGYPYTLRGKTMYSHNVGYYVEEMTKIAKLGIEILGGCCGTTPAHIKALAKVIKDLPRVQKKIGSMDEVLVGEPESEFERKLSVGEKVYIVELDPPFQTDITKVMNGAKELADAKVDMITLSDSPMARTRMDAGQLAVHMQQVAGVPVMPHVCCRDKNVIALRAGMLGTYMNGIRHYLVVTGDPVARGDREHVSAVFDFNSIKLMNYITAMNEEVFAKEPVSFGGALNYHGINADAIIRRMEQKINNGCRYFLTQPIYTMEDVERIRMIKERVDTKILCGIMPLVSYKNAMFVKNEMPGIRVSDEIVSRYRPDMTREEAEETAVAISVEIAERLKDIADGFYFMTPFNRTGLIVRIMEAIRKGMEEEA